MNIKVTRRAAITIVAYIIQFTYIFDMTHFNLKHNFSFILLQVCLNNGPGLHTTLSSRMKSIL